MALERTGGSTTKRIEIRMTIDTNIDVRIFNVLKYLILTILIDVIVRKSLDSFEHFRRRLSLHRGHSVAVSGIRLDRYNLLKTLTTGQTAFALVLFVITMIAYGVEIALEYAVDSQVTRSPIQGNITRAQYRTGMCTMDQLVDLCVHHRDVESMAHSCVVLEEELYRFYRPVWVRASDGALNFICEKVEQNLVYEGEGIYPMNSLSDQVDLFELYQKLHENSNGTVEFYNFNLWAVNVSSKDVFNSNQIATVAGEHSFLYFLANLSGTPWRCSGIASKLPNKRAVFVQVLGCVGGFDENGTLIITFGTSLAEYGGGDCESEEWSTEVMFDVQSIVPHYFRGVALEDNQSEANALAYASFLSRIFGLGSSDLNKYAIVYRHCDTIQVPVMNGTSSWTEQYEFASSKIRVTATVREWGVVLAASWVITVCVGSVLVSWIAKRRKMPTNVFGERQILRRWAEENECEEVARADVDAFLSVERGEKGGHITATLRRRSVQLDPEEQSV
ncbi:hypothetical protein FGB62_349g02 [Gracilaria domingensis]|nr:hypothetical protein FGB62_349g02 [Gracilaria domingensis]